jgi:uridine kinase
VSRSFVVGIGGGSCSGKSTFADALAESLDPLSRVVIRMDRYMIHELGPSITLSTGEELPNNNHPQSTDNDKIIAEIEACGGDVVIVEGLMALHLEEVKHRLDLKLFVETDATTRAMRRIIRSKERKPEQSIEWIARYYLECAVPGYDLYVGPSKREADLIVNGDGATVRAIRFLRESILSMVSERQPDKTHPRARQG